MAELNFLKALDKDQLEYARQVAIKAKELGVPPALAISIAFKESSLRPDAPDSEDGAVGLMQILPKTAKTYGYSEKDLRDTTKNIEAGIKNIKEALEYTGNDPKLTAVYYHSGPDAIADLASGKPMGPRAKEYVKKLNEFGTFGFPATASGEAAPAEQAEQTEQTEQTGQADEGKLDTTGVKMVTPEQDFIRENSEADLRRQEYGLAGGLTGAAIAGAPVVAKVATGAMGRVARAIAPKPTGAPTGGLSMAGAPTPPQAPPSAPTGGLPQGQPQSIMRQGAPATGYGTYNYGLSQGLTDIESGLAKDMTKEAGGVHDLLTQRREAMNRLQGMGVNNFVENPRFGGIMTAAPSVGGGPRESYALRSPEAGQPAQLAPIPKAAPIPTTPPPPSGLDQVKNMFTNMMRQGSKIMPFVGPPLAGLSIGRDLADIQTQYERAPVERDYTDMGLSAAGALATGATLTPAWPAALPLSISLPTVRNIRRNVLAQESDPDYQQYLKSEPTAQELETASRPAFRYARP